MKVTYTYNKLEITVNIKKVWKGGPEEKPDATIYLDLMNNNDLVGTETVIFSNPTKIASVNGVYTWEETKNVTMDVTGLSSYYFLVRENPVTDYRTVKPIAGNWVNGFTITNIYLMDVTAIKEWVGGPEIKPTVYIKLMSQIGNSPKLTAKIAKRFDPGMTEWTWQVPITNNAGIPYVYTAEETTLLADYIKTEDGLTVTNTYNSPKVDVMATKIWIGGPKPAIQLQLFRNEESYLDQVVLPKGQETYTWPDLDERDENGEKYVYSVKEVGTPLKYGKVEDGLTVTNIFHLLESSHTVGPECGIATITLRNVSPWIYPMSVEIKKGDGEWVHSYGPVVDNRTGGELSGPQKDETRTRTLTFNPGSGTHTVRYRVQAGSEKDLYVGLPVGEWTYFTVTACPIPTANVRFEKLVLGDGPVEYFNFTLTGPQYPNGETFTLKGGNKTKARPL